MYRGIYLAGPITGLSFEEATEWRNAVKSGMGLSLTFEIFDPMRGITKKAYDSLVAESLIAEYMVRDLTDIDRCDFVLVNWIPCQYSRPSVGTCVEMGYAMAKGKRIISIVHPTLACHPWVPLVSDIVVPTWNEAIDRLRLLTERTRT